jgi:hypothetical protein
MGGHFTACAALGLAVLLGTADFSAAAPVGPTGKTALECFDAWSKCLNSCLEDFSYCIAAAPSAVCNHADDTCTQTCNRNYDDCKPEVSRRDTNMYKISQLLLEAIGRSSVISRLPAQGDLVPLPTPASTGPQGFCRRNDQGQLLVTIYNQGGGAAVATKTRVVFANGSVADVDTPAVAAGSSAEAIVNIPGACFNASNNCSFTLGADATGVVPESNETNNNAAGICGPQFF